MHHPLLRRAAPLGAVALAATAIAAPGAQGAGGVPAAGGEIIYNTASITLSTFPNGATPITVSRDGVTIGTATANVGAVGGTPGGATLNVGGIVAGAGHVLDCWTGFTPDILPGDTITIGGAAGTTVAAPDFNISNPAQVGSELVTHGSAADVTGAPMAGGVQGALFSPLTRFSAGAKGGQLLLGAVSFDTPGSAAVTTRFAGLAPADMALGLGATSQLTTLPPAVHAGGAAAVMTVGVESPGTPGPVPGCNAPLGSDGVTGASSKTINAATATTAVTISGTSDPNVKSVILNVGGATFPATLAGGTWTATVNPANLPDGNLTAAATFSSAGGTYHGRTMGIVKDTVAPAAVTAGVASGVYDSARSVSLSAERGATIRYTTNGSDPTASSTAYSDPIKVAQTQTLKALAIDAAGNAGQLSQFDYTINPPAVVRPPVVAAPIKVAKLKLESLTLTKRMSIRSARRSGIGGVIYAPEGAKVAKVRILRGAKVIQTIERKVSRDGVLELRLPTSKKVRRSLKRGSYRIEFQVGQSAGNLGAKTVRTVQIV